MSHDLRPAPAKSDFRLPCPGSADGEPCVHARAERQLTIQQVRHELRTPLAALRSFLELASSDNLDADVRRQCIEAIDRNVARLSDALDRISSSRGL
jgi:signal transduction histidine kinase